MTASRIARTMSRRPVGLETAAAPGPQTALGESATFARSRLFRPLRTLVLGATACLAGPAMILAQAGALDTTFGTGGIRVLLFDGGVEESYARDMVLQADDRIVVVGSVTLGSGNSDFGIARLEPDGDDDLSFGDGGRVLETFDFAGVEYHDRASSVAVDPDGRIVVAGSVRGEVGGNVLDYDFGVIRLVANGDPDWTFHSPWPWLRVPFDLGAGNDDHCSSVALQPDGGIVLAGAVMVSAETAADFGLARLTVDGYGDDSFGNGGNSVIPFDVAPEFFDTAKSVALQPDGRIVVAGSIDVGVSPNFHEDFGVTRLWPDGTVDTSFGQPVFAGKVLIPFDLGPGLLDTPNGVALQPDGAILIAGAAQRDGSDFEFAVVRLLPNGWLDPDFGTGGKVVIPVSPDRDSANDIALQRDGKILLTGSSSDDWAVVRLQRDGSLDPSFGNGGIVVLPIDLTVGGSDSATAVELQRDGKIVVAGWARARWSPSELYSYFVVARLLNDLIFADGFESGDTAAWSASIF